MGLRPGVFECWIAKPRMASPLWEPLRKDITQKHHVTLKLQWQIKSSWIYAHGRQVYQTSFWNSIPLPRKGKESQKTRARQTIKLDLRALAILSEICLRSRRRCVQKRRFLWMPETPRELAQGRSLMKHLLEPLLEYLMKTLVELKAANLSIEVKTTIFIQALGCRLPANDFLNLSLALHQLILQNCHHRRNQHL